MPHVTGPQVSAHEVVSAGAGGAPGCRARVERNLAHTLTPGNCTHLGWFPIQAPALGAGAAARGWGIAGGSVGTPGGSSNDPPPAPVSLWEGSCHHPAARPGSGSGSQAEATSGSILRGSRPHPRGLGSLWGTPPPLLELRSCLCPRARPPEPGLRGHTLGSPTEQCLAPSQHEDRGPQRCQTRPCHGETPQGSGRAPPPCAVTGSVYEEHGAGYGAAGSTGPVR